MSQINLSHIIYLYQLEIFRGKNLSFCSWKIFFSCLYFVLFFPAKTNSSARIFNAPQDIIPFMRNSFMPYLYRDEIDSSHNFLIAGKFPRVAGPPWSLCGQDKICLKGLAEQFKPQVQSQLANRSSPEQTIKLTMVTRHYCSDCDVSFELIDL